MLTKEEVLEKIEKGESFAGVEIGDVDFSGHVFDKNVDLSKAIFTGKANFRDVKFNGDNYFRITKFLGRTDLSQTIFTGKADFQGAEFNGKALFRATKFLGDAEFGHSTFLNVTFMNTLFNGETSFILTLFKNEANFYNVKFSEVLFLDVTFLGSVSFLGSNENKVFSNTKLTVFWDVIFKKPEEASFQMVDFSKCSFTNTDLSRVELLNISWLIKKIVLDSRKALYDENALDAKKKYQLIEKTYRDLKKNYENRGSYGEAGDFHYGEMEMRRLSQKGISRYVSFLWLYKVLSGYGEKHWRAIFWLGAFLLAYLGAYRFIEYNALPFRDGLWNSLIHTLQVITFQTDRSYYPKTDWGTLADAGLKVFIPLQATLAILAIKRKFKR